MNKLFLIPCLILSLLAPVLAQDTKEDAEVYYKLGQAYYEQGRYKEAEELFQKSVNILSRLREEEQPARPSERAAEEEKTSPVPAVKPRPALLRQEYLVGEEDVLQISVWQNPDLDSEVIVRPDGMISCPLIGDVPAEGQTITQLSAEIREKLAEYVREPQVSVSIRKIGGKRVIVLGQVTTPGIISAGGAMKVMDAIGLAGGFTRDAIPSSTVIIRGGFQGAKAQKLNLAKVFKGDLKDNIPLQSQDIIFVPRKFISDLNYFLEQVLEPLARGAYVSKEVQAW